MYLNTVYVQMEHFWTGTKTIALLACKIAKLVSIQVFAYLVSKINLSVVIFALFVIQNLMDVSHVRMKIIV